MGFQSLDSTYPASGECVIVVIDANRSKTNVDSLDWAIKNIVRPKDTVVALVVLSEIAKKHPTSCFPHLGIRLSGIWIKLEFSRQGEMNPSQLEEDIETKRDEYQTTLQPFYRQCKKNGVKLDVKLAAGFNPIEITVEQAHRYRPRWIVLDSHLKNDRVYIYGHVACNVAVMKRKNVATLMPSKTSNDNNWPLETIQLSNEDAQHHYDGDYIRKSSWSPSLMPESPCWYPLSWRTGFPRAFSIHELEEITDCFTNENIIYEKGGRIAYEAIFKETPVLVTRFNANDDRAWSNFKILSRIRHRNIWNLVGHCCTRDYIYLIRDYPCNGNLELNLLCDGSAKNITWELRWYMALEIGAAIRYLHEECGDGPIVNISVSSSHIVFSHDYCASLSMHYTAKWLENDTFSEKLSAVNIEKEEYLFGDVRDYGMFLIELITGKSASDFQQKGEGKSLIDWALPFLQNGLISKVMDQRLDSTRDVVLDHMVRAALLCLENDFSRKLSMSEVLAVVRGDKLS